jgi:hypothetical protein
LATGNLIQQSLLVESSSDENRLFYKSLLKKPQNLHGDEKSIVSETTCTSIELDATDEWGNLAGQVAW